MRRRRLDGSFTQPVTVVMRSTSGLPSVTASAMAAAVLTLNTSAPASAGNLPRGTCRPVTTSMSCFSPPCGYFVGNAITSMPSCPAAAFRIASMASGLLSSMAITPRRTPVARRMSLSPSTMRGPFSSMLRWSAVRYGSHSAPLRMTISACLSGGTFILTCVGNDAPPMPQMPASSTAGMIFSGSTVSTSPTGVSSTHSSRMSF